MSKKLIIIVAAAGLASFAGTFMFAWSSGKSKTQSIDSEAEQALASQEDAAKPWNMDMAPSIPSALPDSEAKKAMTLKQLRGLICEVREKIGEYEARTQELEQREQRLGMAEEVVKQDIEELDNLRIELASAINKLKDERSKLEKSRIEINQSEQSNLSSIAATYDKMDSASASKILTSMSKSETGSTNDAIKILYFMSERSRAKLLAELAASEPELAAYFCQKLKKISERE